MENYRKALAEVDMIIENIPDQLKKMIPVKMIEMLKREKDFNYKPEINELVIKNNILPETTVILALLYRDFLCSSTEKEVLQLKDKKVLQKLKQEEGEQKFNYEGLFPKHIKNEKEEIQLVEVKEKWYIKLIACWRNKRCQKS